MRKTSNQNNSVISLFRLFWKWDVEQASLQLSQENADRRFSSDAGRCDRQCIPGSGGRHRESPVSKSPSTHTLDRILQCGIRSACWDVKRTGMEC